MLTMQPARIAELLRPFLTSSERGCHSEERSDEEPAVLSPKLLEHISMYIDILLRWNARINLTAIRDPEQIVTRHFGESLFAAHHLLPLCSPVPPVVKNPEVADVGSGAGFPGIPLKLWASHIKLTLTESNHKKAAFLREVSRTLTLTDINILSARAETLLPATFNLLTLRAVERFEATLPVAARLVAPGGRFALLIGKGQVSSAQRTLPRLRWNEPVAIPESNARILLVGSN